MSVVVPVHNAAATLTDCVEAILSQEYPPDLFEAVFVENGSKDSSPRILASYGDRIRAVAEPRRGPGAARNAGALQARHEWLAFTDADCTPHRGWLDALTRCALEHPQASMIGGQIVAGPPRGPIQLYSEGIFDQERSIMRERLPYVISANLLLRRSTLVEAGMFDEFLYRGEDVDLSYRVRAVDGSGFVYAHDAVVTHAHPASITALLRKGYQHGWAVGGLAERHGKLRGESALARLFSARRYGRIARALGSLPLVLTRAVPSRGVGQTIGAPTDSRGLASFYDAVFNGGKQAGVGAYVFARAWRSVRRTVAGGEEPAELEREGP